MLLGLQLVFFLQVNQICVGGSMQQLTTGTAPLIPYLDEEPFPEVPLEPFPTASCDFLVRWLS